MRMSDKFPNKEALIRELEHYIAYLKHLYEKGEQTHTLSDAAFTFLVRDMERIIEAVKNNLQIDESRLPAVFYKTDSEPAILDMFPFVDEFKS